jgi:DNA gyrase subunit A
VAFFTNYGTAYVSKINDIPATTGYGDPAQKLFKFKDGERIVAAMTFDPRALPPAELLTISARGFGQRFPSEPFNQPTTRAGRRFAKVSKGDEIVDVKSTSDDDIVIVATSKGHVLSCKADEINKLENPGKGVTVIKTMGDDRVIGFVSGQGRGDVLHVESGKGGRKFELHVDARRVTARGGKGQQIVKRSKLTLAPQAAEVPVLANTEETRQVH